MKFKTKQEAYNLGYIDGENSQRAIKDQEIKRLQSIIDSNAFKSQQAQQEVLRSIATITDAASHALLSFNKHL